jgi:FAD:protein FMN transferase
LQGGLALPQLQTISFYAMGTECFVHFYASDSKQVARVTRAVVDEVLRIEWKYSRYRQDSLLSAINRAALTGEAVSIDQETVGLLEYAAEAHKQSDGLFDITAGVLRRAWDFKSNTIPHESTIDRLLPLVGFHLIQWSENTLSFAKAGIELDFGGIGKEYAADRAAETCLELGIERGLIDFGGDIRVLGPRPNDEPWEIGIRHPRSYGKCLATVKIKRGAIATSGDYERCIRLDDKVYSHILNPLTGWPANGLCSVSVVSDRSIIAGALSTIAILKERQGIIWLEQLGVEHLWVDCDLNVGRSTTEIEHA